jgi:cyclic pyranopterin phosphate synthase
MPEGGVGLMEHKEILSYEEIVKVVLYGVRQGIDKIRITGGEPLVRKGIVDLVSMISAIRGITDLSMTTNGVLLEQYASRLKKAGLQRINISLDTLNPDKYRQITRFGEISDVLRGIEAARSAGLNPVKINCVIKKSHLEKDAREVKEFCLKHNLQVRFIREMNLMNGSFAKVIGGDGGNCKACNRLRLTANGKLKPCLFSDIEFDVRKLGIEQAFNLAIENKPRSGTENRVNSFCNIGG